MKVNDSRNILKSVHVKLSPVLVVRQCESVTAHLTISVHFVYSDLHAKSTQEISDNVTITPHNCMAFPHDGTMMSHHGTYIYIPRFF